MKCIVIVPETNYNTELSNDKHGAAGEAKESKSYL
jgi:hypothetical protein